MKFAIALLFLIFSYPNAYGQELSGTKSTDLLLFTGFFDGTEPFWSISFEKNLLTMEIDNETLVDSIVLSEKQTHSQTWAFRGNDIFGIIRKSHHFCTLDITEVEHPTHEIYFNYKNSTYMGCGNLSINETYKDYQLLLEKEVEKN